MASKVIERIQNNAERLYEIRKAIATYEEHSKQELEAMKLERDAVQAVLLKEMGANNLSSMKVRSGDTFARQTRKSLEVLSEMGALKWALDNKCYALNRIAAMQVLKDAKEVPTCFEVVESEFISVRKSTKKNEEV